MWLITLVGFVACLAILVWSTLRCPKGKRLSLLRSRPDAWLLMLLAIVALALDVEDVPRQVRFSLSKESLERAAQAPKSTLPVPRWIGLYHVHGIHAGSHGGTVFEMGECGMFATCTLVYEPAGDTNSVRGHKWLPDEHWSWLEEDHF